MEMNKYLILLIVSVCYFENSEGQIGAPCHFSVLPVVPRHSLNITSFMGTWYGQEYATSDIGNTPELEYKCLKLDFKLTNPEDLLHIDNVETYTNIDTGISHTGYNKVVVNSTRSPLNSIWEVTSENGKISATQIIIATDLQFDSWSVVYSCQIRENGYRWETATIYTREQHISDSLRNFTKALSVGLGFRIGDHRVMSQENCK